MTVSTEVDHNEYTGNGVTTSFPYTFRIFKKSDLVVQVSDLNGNVTVLVLDTGYTVTGAGTYSGGAVVLPSPLAAGWRITIERVLNVVQKTDLRNQGKFFPEVHEDAFDYLTMLIQKCFGWFRRSLMKPSLLAKYYDAKQNRISNLADPGVPQDAVNNRSMRNYVDAAIAGVVGGYGWFIQYGSGAIYRTFQDKMREVFSVKDFGAKGDGVTDDTAAIHTACSALNDYFLADGVRRTLVFPDGTYRTSSTVVSHPNMCIHCIGNVIFQNANKDDKSFAAFEIQGGAHKTVLGVIDAYGVGFIVRGNTHNIEFQTISNCIDGFVIRADINWTLGTKNSLDNKITGIQIGKCTNGIVFEQNGDSLIQQGNEVRVNFVSETNNTVLFRNYDGFSHTKQSNWDSNFIELIASDPTKLPGSSMVMNTTNYGVPNLTFNITNWCGGWIANAGTICLIRGAFTTCRFMFNLAADVGVNEVVDSHGKSSFGSCKVSLCRQGNLGSGYSFYTAVTPGDIFNNGIAVKNDKFRIRVTIPDLAAGQVYGSSFWHVLVQQSGTSRVRLEQVAGAVHSRNGILIELTDAGTELVGMVRIWVKNTTQDTISARNIDFIVSVS
ncbi:hypothetical protein FCX78_00660 [Escherichia coli]|nr:hypothetical protein [Escherichia coli]MDN0641866.1 hypothetical protein [Escherichia coli]